MKRVFLVGMIVLVLSICFVPLASAQKTFTVGIMGAMSGSAAIWGLNVEHGLELAIEEINAAGGINVKGERYLVKFISGDHKARSADATTIANKMIFKDKVTYIVGNCVGATCDAAQAVTEPNKVVFLFQCWGTKNLGPDKPYSFRAHISQWEIAPQLYNFLHQKHPEAKTLALISPNDTSGWDTTEADKKEGEKNKMKIVSNEFYKRGSTDYYPVLNKIMATKPDMIDLAGSAPGDAGLIFKQLNELGYKGIKVWTCGDPPEGWINISGMPAGEGVYLGLAPNFDAGAAKEVQNYSEKYHQKYKDALNHLSISNYIGMKALAKAIEKAGTFDTTAVVEELEKLKFDTPFGAGFIGGKKTYGTNRQFIWPVTISQVQGGKAVDVFRSKEVSE
jgi:branched-chain amino acid transport system substrate-binding protein